MPKNDTYRLSPRVSYEFAGDRSILMLEDVGEVYLCNATLTEFLRILDGRLSIIEIAQLLLEKYDSSPDVITRDLYVAAGELARKGILENV